MYKKEGKNMNINARGKRYLKGAGIVMIIVAAINFIYSLQYILDFNIFVLWGICYSVIYMVTGIYGVKNAKCTDKKIMNVCMYYFSFSCFAFCRYG